VLRFLSSRRNWDYPTPSPAGECAPPLWYRGRGILAGERGGGRVLISTRGHTQWYSISMFTLWYSYLWTQYVENTDGVLQYRIPLHPHGMEETVYSTSSGLYPALSIEEAANRVGGHTLCLYSVTLH
jgi:hypothetical protein